MVSTGIAGLAAMWLYLIAPTAHTLLAARFLCLNWVEGLVTLSLIAAAKGKEIEEARIIEFEEARISQFEFVEIRSKGSHLRSNLVGLRLFLLLCEILGLQFLIQNRLQSLWPALNRPGCKVWLARCLRMEVAGLFLGVLFTNFARYHDSWVGGGGGDDRSFHVWWRTNVLLHLDLAGDSDTVSCRFDVPESPTARQKTRLGL